MWRCRLFDHRLDGVRGRPRDLVQALADDGWSLGFAGIEAVSPELGWAHLAPLIARL